MQEGRVQSVSTCCQAVARPEQVQLIFSFDGSFEGLVLVVMRSFDNPGFLLADQIF